MRYIGIIISLVLCLNLLSFTGCMINTVKPEIASGNLENQEDFNQSSNNSQSSLTGPVEEPVIVDTEETVTVYPQQWATGDGTAENPWANGCIKSAYDNVPEGGTIFLEAGYYILSAILPIYKKVNIIGEGRDKTIIVLDITDTSGIYIEADYVTLKGFTIDGASQTDGVDYVSCIAIGHPSNYLTLEDIEVKNAGEIGINYGNINHSTFKNIYVHDNYTHGLHATTTLVGRGKYNTYRDIYSWDNGKHGFDDGGAEDCHNLYDNIQCWDNGEDGINFWDTSGGIVSNCSAWGNAENGIVLGHAKNFDVHDCIANLNDYYGIRTVITENINFTNVTAKNNYTGIAIEDCSNIVLTSCQSYDDRDTPLQRYGIQLTETNTGISLLNCKLTPNQYGDIYNPNGVAVKVITEKNVGQILAALSVVIVLCIFLVFSKICR